MLIYDCLNLYGWNIRPSEIFYHSKLVSSDSCENRDLSILMKRRSSIDSSESSLRPPFPCCDSAGSIVPNPLRWLDTAGNEAAREDSLYPFDRNKTPISTLCSQSRTNVYEVLTVIKYLELLSTLIVEDDHHKMEDLIGVITPYSAQNELLKQTLCEVYENTQ